MVECRVSWVEGVELCACVCVCVAKDAGSIYFLIGKINAMQ